MVACLQATAEACFPQLLPAALGIFCDADVGEVGGQGVLVLAHDSQLCRPCTPVVPPQPSRSPPGAAVPPLPPSACPPPSFRGMPTGARFGAPPPGHPPPPFSRPP
jgi:hypothetical protein